jgi:cytoskeletal protein CcmA (bactofilin family)
LALALAAVAVLPAPSWARHRTRFDVEAGNARQGDVSVPKGETLRENLSATGDITVDGVVDGDCVSLGGRLVVNGEVHGDAAALGGPADVSGTVSGDMAVMGGPLHLSGTVRGDVADMGGDVTLDPKAEIGGDLSLLGGKLHKADGAVIKGTLSNVDLGLAKTFVGLLPALNSVRHSSSHVEKILSPLDRLLGFIIYCISTAGMGFIILLLTLFLPQNVESIGAKIKCEFWKSAGIGALILLLTIPGFVLMLVSLIGWPLIPVALLLYCAAVFMALAACCQILAGRLYEVRQLPVPTSLIAGAQGYGLLVCISFIGELLKLLGGVGDFLGMLLVIANLVLISGGVAVGMGAVWQTRMGTRAKTPPPAPSPAAPVIPAPQP